MTQHLSFKVDYNPERDAGDHSPGVSLVWYGTSRQGMHSRLTGIPGGDSWQSLALSNLPRRPGWLMPLIATVRGSVSCFCSFLALEMRKKTLWSGGEVLQETESLR